MKLPRHGTFAAAAALILLQPPAAQSAPAAPPFDVAYRAWELVTGLAREHAEPALSGQCGKSFQPYVVPALRRQTRHEQDAAGSACQKAAQAACTSGALRRTAETERRCREFR